MGNECCKKPDNEFVLDTMLVNNKNDKDIFKDTFPHDTDSGFKIKKKIEGLKDLSSYSYKNFYEKEGFSTKNVNEEENIETNQ